MQYNDFYEIEEIGSGGYGTVYTAKYKKWPGRQVVLKRFNNIDGKTELFISEVSIHTRNISYCIVIVYVHTRAYTGDYESDFNLIIIHHSHLIVQKSCCHVYT